MNKVPERADILDETRRLWTSVLECKNTQELDDLSLRMLAPHFDIDQIKYGINAKFAKILPCVAFFPFGASVMAIMPNIIANSGHPSFLTGALPSLALLEILRRLQRRFLQENECIEMKLRLAEDIGLIRGMFHLHIVDTVNRKLINNFDMEYKLLQIYSDGLKLKGDSLDISFLTSVNALHLLMICNQYSRLLELIVAGQADAAAKYIDLSVITTLIERITIVKVKAGLMKDMEIVRKTEILLECISVLHKLLACYEGVSVSDVTSE